VIPRNNNNNKKEVIKRKIPEQTLTFCRESKQHAT